MSFRAEEGAAASGLAINLPSSISPEILMAALEISKDLSGRLQTRDNTQRDAVTVGRGAAGSVALNIYTSSADTSDRDMTEAHLSVSRRDFDTNDEELLKLARERPSCTSEILKVLSRRPKQEEIFELSFLVLDDWEELKIYITPNSALFKRRTNTIAADRIAETQRKSKRFFDMWVATFGTKANVYRLCKVLIERGKRDHAAEIFGEEPVAFIEGD